MSQIAVLSLFHWVVVDVDYFVEVGGDDLRNLKKMIVVEFSLFIHEFLEID